MTVVDDVTLDTTNLGIRGTVELDDDQADVVRLGQTVRVVLRGRVVRKAAEPGGQHTTPRQVVTVSLDSLDELDATDALPGQMALGEEPPAASDDE